MNWQKLNRQGLFPGPKETKESFLQRVDFCQHLTFHLQQHPDVKFPFPISDQVINNEITKDAFLLCSKTFGMMPDWALIIFHNYKLLPWHGGCAWIFQLDATSPLCAFLQLRKEFKNYSSYLGIYQRSELIAHEMAHVGRMAYEEPKFEELLAYRSSSSFWHKNLSPLVQSANERLFFVILLVATLLTSLTALLVDSFLLTQLSLLALLAPFIAFIMALLRLLKRQSCLKKTLNNLKKIVCKKDASHLLYRLSDKEIFLFANSTPAQISEYIKMQTTCSFRWQFLQQCYFNFS